MEWMIIQEPKNSLKNYPYTATSPWEHIIHSTTDSMRKSFALPHHPASHQNYRIELQ